MCLVTGPTITWIPVFIHHFVVFSDTHIARKYSNTAPNIEVDVWVESSTPTTTMTVPAVTVTVTVTVPPMTLAMTVVVTVMALCSHNRFTI